MKVLFEVLEAQLSFSIVYHPKTDGSNKNNQLDIGGHVMHVRNGLAHKMGIVLTLGRICIQQRLSSLSKDELV